jgi:outer membrane protein assembly factor BamB
MNRKIIHKKLYVLISSLIVAILLYPITFANTSSLLADNSITSLVTGHDIHLVENHRLPKGYTETHIPETAFPTTSAQHPKQLQPQKPAMAGKDADVSPWPMYCHDTKHTGLSPYTTGDNPMTEKWRYTLFGVSYNCAPVLDKNGTIYVGRGNIYAIYPNGTLKWEFVYGSPVETCPAIDEQRGVMYYGIEWDLPNYLYALYLTNGSTKWKYRANGDVTSSPNIDSEGTIYFGDWNGDVHAVYPNGTRKWMYHTGDVITSSPAIGDDGTIYIGSHDDYVYAFYPNGTVKWRFLTDSWVHGSPTIAADGTVYIGSDDDNLYALNPEDGSLIWRCAIGSGNWGSPTLGPDGTLYLGTWRMNFYAIRPNGTIKWTYTAPGRIWQGASAALSNDGILYFGTTWFDGGVGAFIALNASDGHQRFIDYYGWYETSPAIAEDGTVYAVTSDTAGDYGILHVFGRGELRADAGGPYAGYAGEPFTVNEMIYGGTPPYSCYWDFGDGNTSNERHSTHLYHAIGQYNITFTVTDSQLNTSTDYATITITYGRPHVSLVKPTCGLYIANIKIISFDSPRYLIFGRITLIVNASHPVAGIDHVDFYIDGKLQATDTTPPYTYLWKQRYFRNYSHNIYIVVVSTVGTSDWRYYDMIWKIF